MDRETFLARVREAARQGRAYRVKTKELPPVVGYVGAGDDLPASLAAEIDAVGGQAYLVDDVAQARDRLADLLLDERPQSAFCWEHPLLQRLGLKELLETAGIECISHERLASLSHDEQRRTMLNADIGVASADYAVAETGTLAVASAPGRERAVTLLPPVLVNVVASNQIVPDLFDLFTKLGATGGEEAGPIELPSNLSLITGPSKTGDIELQLTTGVHGPGKWHVIVIRESVS